jgi:hypothetical protein
VVRVVTELVIDMPGVTDERLAQHLLVVEAIQRHGGRLVASFELDVDGRTVGEPATHNRRRRCGACGEYGHDLKRCMGEGAAPKPYSVRTKVSAKVRQMAEQADRTLAKAREEIQRRIAEKKR